jgi:polar amino acid transport system substrate-binding protein
MTLSPGVALQMTASIRALVATIVLFACMGNAHAAPLLIAVEDAAAPWSYQDGTGYANDLVREAFRAVGVEVTFKVVPYVSCKRLVVNGAVVGCFSMSPEPGLEREVTFAETPLFTVWFDYFYNRKKPLAATSEGNIPRGTLVGIVIGYEYPPYVRQLKGRGVILQESRDEETNLKKLAHGRIDAAIITHNDLKPVETMIVKAGATGSIEFLFRSGVMGSFIGFSKKHPQGEVARKKFNEGFRIIRKNGRVKQIMARWDQASKSELFQ